MTEQLLATGKHTITALTRKDSSSKLPAGVQTVAVDYEDEESIASALKGQQFLVITLANGVPPEVHHRIVRAAGKAGVPHIMPNIYATNIVLDNKGAVDPFFPVQGLRDLVAEIDRVGLSSWTVLVGGVWYDYSLPGGPMFLGFDIKNREVTLVDNGTSKINTATWAQYARALAGLVSLKELPEDENDTSPTVSQFRNKPLYTSSFHVSQRDILASVQRVTGTTDADWTIKNQTLDERMAEGQAEIASGNFTGMVKVYYSYLLSQKGQPLNFEDKLHNELLGLPKEDLDELTKKCVKAAEDGYNPFM